MFKNTNFYALALLVTVASVSFASEPVAEAVANPAETTTTVPAAQDQAQPAEPAQAQEPVSAAPKKECKYKRFVLDNKKSFIAGGVTIATVAAVLGFVYNKRKTQASR